MRQVRILILLLAVASAVQAQAPAALTPEVKQRVDAIVNQMTTEEKIDYIGGTGFAVRAMPRLGLPALEMSDGPLGVRSNFKFPSTVYAAGIGLAATWNPQLAQRVGRLARERRLLRFRPRPLRRRNIFFHRRDQGLFHRFLRRHVLGVFLQRPTRFASPD